MCQWHTRKLRDYRYLDVDEVYQYPFEEGIASTRPLRVIEGASKNLVIVVDTLLYESAGSVLTVRFQVVV